MPLVIIVGWIFKSLLFEFMLQIGETDLGRNKICFIEQQMTDVA